MLGKLRKKKVKAISSDVATAIMSGENWLSAVQILQALNPVRKLLEDQIEGLEEIVNDFKSAGGKLDLRDTSKGFFIIAQLNSVVWAYEFDSAGNKLKLTIEDSTPTKADPDSFEEVRNALEAAYEIPRREFALTELDRIVDYIENDNALAGLDRIRQLLSDNENIVYQTAASAGLNEIIEPILELKE